MRDLQTAVSLLIDRADPHLTADDLRSLEGAAALAQMQASTLNKIMMDLGALVANDTEAGYFQSKDEVAGLLWHVAHAADSIAALLEIADRAACVKLSRKQREARP